ncbi:MAG: hypothetical protein ACJ795_18615 [Ktedonobacteraceae bacterium]
MSITKRSIFRARAIQHYARSREKDVLPRFVSPPVFWCLWTVLSLCLVLGWLVWDIRIPVYLPGIGAVVTNHSSGAARVVLFVSADQQRSVHPGEPVRLQIGSTGSLLLYTITTVAPALLSPEEARQQYHLDGSLSLLVIQPSVVALVTLDARVPASTYAGSIVHAQIQDGTQRVLAFLPIVGPLIGE